MDLVVSVLSKEFPTDQAAYATEDLVDVVKTYKGPGSTFFIADESGKVVGTCGVIADGPQAILRRLFVDPKCRGRGIGHELLLKTLKFCEEQGFEEVIIRTSTNMEQAIRLCESMGFEEDGRWTLGEVTLIRYRLRLT